ncbi:MAG: ShlB/FhaC/HecB family hemolysin secretion/activation protein [Burkholderiales bacterium]|nr:ShlB/FhaC/HecB family hemolysin secretion/activation protein [Burkholderiales bacterium]
MRTLLVGVLAIAGFVQPDAAGAPTSSESTRALSPASSRLAQASPAKPVAETEPAAGGKALAPVPAEAPPAPRFAISRYLVEGNTLLGKEAIERLLAPFTGPGKDFGDVQRALEALQSAYQQAGYGAVGVRLPEQELERGEVRLRVIEPRIGRVVVEGNEHFSAANIRASVPALREGETPRSHEIARGVRLANENPAKQSAVVLRAGESEERIDATIRVVDFDPRRYSVSLDNTGNEDTQPLRLGLAFQHANLFGRDHVLTTQFITAPENFNDVTVFGVGYRIPFYSLGHSLDLVAGYSNVDSGTVENLFNVSGQGSLFAARYNQNLPRWGDVEHRLTYGLEYRAYQNDVKPVGGNAKLVPDVTVHPLSLTYGGAWRTDTRGDLTYYLSFQQNIPGGSDGQDDDFRQVGARFPEGNADYQLFRAGLTYSRPIGADWQVRVRVDGQYTDDALVSGEMFGIGGADSVRGFDERYTSNDKGYRTSWEIYTPDVAKRLKLDGRLRLLAFYDQGTVRRNKVQPGELSAASLDSGGLGLRMNYKTGFTLRLDVAYVFHDGTQQQEYNGKRSSTKGHFSMAWVW